MTPTAHEVMRDGSMAEFAMTQFTPEEFQRFWPKLEREMDNIPHTWRHWTKEYIYASVMGDTMQVWGIGRPPKATLIILTTINVFPAIRVLTITWAMGEFNARMLPLLDAALTGYARLNRCDEIEVRGRAGWDPALKSVGFERSAMVWTRAVDRRAMN